MSSVSKAACPLMQAAQGWFGCKPSIQEETRWRVLQAALEVFSEVGYRAATTRAICSRAQVNLASIHYHFGDKAALYREVFRLPFLRDAEKFSPLDIDNISLQEMLQVFYESLLPLPKEADPMLYLFMRLHAREEVEPTGVLGDAMASAIRPNHDRLEAMLCRELGLQKPDLEVQRLSFSLVGLGITYVHSADTVDHLAPNLLHGKKARVMMVSRLVEYAVALITFERKRRALERKEKK